MGNALIVSERQFFLQSLSVADAPTYGRFPIFGLPAELKYCGIGAFYDLTARRFYQEKTPKTKCPADA
jgi:hypothetical protein